MWVSVKAAKLKDVLDGVFGSGIAQALGSRRSVESNRGYRITRSGFFMVFPLSYVLLWMDSYLYLC